ncbi:MAG: hypothetical protein LBR30_05775, partial [Clostridioides sp.]|nr:hypothetical protein [Clostridioides sp.]
KYFMLFKKKYKRYTSKVKNNCNDSHIIKIQIEFIVWLFLFKNIKLMRLFKMLNLRLALLQIE